MEAAQSLIRPAARCCLSASTRPPHLFRPTTGGGGSSNSSSSSSLELSRRQKSTSARTKRSLNIPPHPSFLARDSRFQQDHIIFNPPSAAPSVYHTPFKFLPKSDPRRRDNLMTLFGTSTAAAAAAGGGGEQQLPPRMKPEWTGGLKGGRAPITREEVAEMRKLRAEDPWKWTVHRLAEKYDIPFMLVMTVCQAPKERISYERERMLNIQERWGPVRTKAREDRKRRSEMLYRGEL